MVGVAGADVLVVLTRAPSAGGKSRLFAELGMAPDPLLRAALLLDTIDGAAPRGSPWTLVVAVEPAEGTREVASLVPGREVVTQPEGSLGDRMYDVIEARFAAGAARVVLIGSDLPAMTADRVSAAFEVLRRSPGTVVLGPADDGGYYLIGATATPPVFAGIDWGRPDVLARTRTAAELAGCPVALIAPLPDVDGAADLAAVPDSAWRTRAWLRRARPAAAGL